MNIAISRLAVTCRVFQLKWAGQHLDAALQLFQPAWKGPHFQAGPLTSMIIFGGSHKSNCRLASMTEVWVALSRILLNASKFAAF